MKTIFKKSLISASCVMLVTSQNYALAAQSYKYIKSVKTLVVADSPSAPASSASTPSDTTPSFATLELTADNSDGNFGDVAPNTSKTVSYILKNTSTVTAKNVVSSLSGVGNTFTLGGNCSSTLTAGSSCTVSITYTPAAASNGIEKTLTIEAENLEDPLITSLTATTVETPSVEILIDTSPDLGNVKVGFSKTVNFIVSNKSWGSKITDFRADLIGDYPDFSISSSCGTEIAVNQTCMVAVTYTPTTQSEWASILLNIGASNLNDDYHKNVTGSSLNENASVSITSDATTFDSTTVGTRKDKVYTVHNTGTITALAPAFTVYGTNYSLASTTCGSTLAAGQTCTATVTYAPTQTTSLETGSLKMSADNMSSPASIDILGYAIAQSAQLPTTVTMGYSLPGDQTNIVSYQVQNYNFGQGFVTSQVTTNTASNEFSVSALTSSDTDCSSLTPEAHCTVYIKYTPSSGNNQTKTASIRTTANLTVTDTNVTAYTDSYSITNSLIAGADATNNYVRLTTAHVSAGGIKSAKLVQAGTVMSTASSIVANNSKDIYMHFPGPAAGVYDLYAYDINGKMLALIPSAINVYAYSVVVTPVSGTDFGSAVGVGSTSSLSFNVQNTGSGTLTGISATTTGTGLAVDTLASTCGTTLSAGATCQVVVKFTPSTAGTLSSVNGALNVTTTQSGTITKPLTGTSVIPVLPSTTSANYSDVNVGDESLATGSILVTNQSNQSLTGVSIVVSSATPGEFTYSTTYKDTASVCPATLASGDYCTVSIKPTPTSVGTKTATVQFNSATYTNNTLATVTANAVQPAISTAGLTAGAAGSLSISSTSPLANGSSVVLKSGSTTISSSSSVSYTSATKTLTANFTTLPAAATYEVYVLNSSSTVLAKAGAITVAAPGITSAMLMHFDSTIATVDGVGFTATGGGSSGISATASKFGGASLYMDGTTYFKSDSTKYNASKLNFNAFNAWTVETWVNITTLDSRNRRIIEGAVNQDMSNWGQIALTVNSTGTYLTIDAQAGIAPSSNGVTISGSALTTGTWHHIAGVYDGANYSLYVDGARVATAASAKKPYSSTSNTNPIFALGSNSGYSMIGYLDELRIVTGTALYSGTSYAVPTGPAAN